MRWLAIILVALAIGMAVFLWPSSPIVARYKLTVEIDTPSGPRTAAVVREVQLRSDRPKLPESSGVRSTRMGEALPVDLGDRTLFILNLRNVEATILEQFPSLRSGSPSGESEVVRLTVGDPTWENRGLPRMVWFEDASRPETVHEVLPSQLGHVFGNGVAIRGATLQLVDEPVTRGIDRVLPWLESYRQRRLRLSGKTGAITTNELADQLGPGDFREGLSS